MADQTSEKTLASTISSSDQLEPTDSVSTETAASGSLSRNSSFSKLNALAPEFIPRKTTPPPNPLSAGDPMVMIIPPPPPPPPAMVHVFPPQVNSPFPAMPLPHIDHHHHHQYHHHHQQQQQQQHYPHQNHHSHHHRNESHRNHHHKHHHHQQQLHRGNNGEQEGMGQGSNQQDKEQGQGNNGGSRNKNGLSEESTQKLINQACHCNSLVHLVLFFLFKFCSLSFIYLFFLKFPYYVSFEFTYFINQSIKIKIVYC